jgi:hypothetical protein
MKQIRFGEVSVSTVRGYLPYPYSQDGGPPLVCCP